MPNSKIDQATELLSQMIEASEFLDKKQKQKDKGSIHPEGESWMTFHLKVLKNLLKEKVEDDS